MMRTPRSYLFVPGQSPERFSKAVASGADAIILDLEDAVGPDAKSRARDNVMMWLRKDGEGIVRINGVDSPWFEEDLAALSGCQPMTVMVPKAQPIALTTVAERLPGFPLIALIESVEGLALLRQSVACAQVDRLAFGNLDFSADARISGTGPVLDPARFEIVLASRLGGLHAPIDGVTVELGDTDALKADIGRSRMAGFGAKLCIHPAQIDATNAGFIPSGTEIDWARRVLAAIQTAAGSVVQVDGKMVDRPVIERARQVLGAAGLEV